jgi:hypothetical protein
MVAGHMSGRIWVLVAAVLALGGVGVSYWAFFTRTEQAPEQATPVAPETLRVAQVSGVVELGGETGSFRPAHVGDTLSSRDRIRTGDDGAAQLLAADGSIVKLLAATDVRVAELRRELKRLHLGAGMLEADVRDDPARVLEVELDDHGGKARTRGAAFTASANGAGSAAVATRRGEVILSARGKEVVIRTGQYARLSPGAPPEEPAPVPPSLFLKVEWPPTASKKSQVVVSGETAPGARVRVSGHYVPVDEKGAYRTVVPLADGTHQLDVHAIDVAGHVVDEKSPRILVDTATDFKVVPPKWK